MADPKVIATFFLCAAALVWLGAFLYRAGTVRGTVTPKIIERLTSPAPKEPEPKKPPAPKEACPFCRQETKWLLAEDWSTWQCGKCERNIAGPKPRITA